MQPFEEQEDPSFASVVEPAQLQRPHCDQCLVAIADYECLRCIQRFCSKCELIIHHRLEKIAIKHEESKSDGRPHLEFLKWISACQDCGEKTLEFFCLNCNLYQCENCCATKHLQLGPHFFFCVEGSSPKMLPFATWNLMFVETVKMSKGNMQDRASAIEAAVPVTRTTPEAQRWLQTKSLKRQAKHSSRGKTTSFVDLTLDDESNASPSGASTLLSAQPFVKEEARVKTEDAWLTSTSTAQENSVFDVETLMENSLGEDEDPILRFMVGEYNQLSAKIFTIDQETGNVRKKTKELSSVQPMDIQEVNRTRVMANKLRKEKAELEKARDGVVAKIVYYVKPDPEELKGFLGTCAAEVSYAQTTCHRKCATLEASIRQNLENIGRIQHDMEELINMKKDAFAEVTRLGAEIAQGEQEVRKLDKERQDEFLRLCQFSKSIQTAVQEMAANT
ncbi:unnamed protein product [Peronospora destructor]|uniref:B box-type domain-containing protein n=1 Tax=Peronospora destructor TaxID=86335 RepID=A0AAV0UH18_9STRA|nr:unnamed protein product [Peronospora destructor]